MSFGLVLILGGDLLFKLWKWRFYQRLRTGRVDMQGALVCGVWEIVITFAPWLLILLLESWKKRSQENLPVEVQSNFVEERPRFLANRYLSRIAVAGAFIFPLSFLVILDRSTWEVFFSESVVD
jgi:ABC-type Fe3+ transport system permease subunit